MNIAKKLIRSENPKIRLPYVLYIPQNYSSDSKLIVNLSTTGMSNDNVENIINSMVDKEMSSDGMDYMLHELVERLSYPAILPLIPRIDGFYTTYLGSKIIDNDFSATKNLSENDKSILSDIDRQLREMILEASNILGVDSRAILKGYSATAKFATQFSILHPDVVSYNISGGTGGLSCLPIPEYQNISLPYPIGTYGIDFDEKNFRKIKHFFYIGSEDVNNPAMPLAELSGKTDINGNPLPAKDEKGDIIFIYDSDGLLLPYYRDCYSKEEINIIHNIYGDDNLTRFKINAKIYDDLGIDSKHMIYPGDHVSLWKNCGSQICSDIVAYITDN